MQLFFKSLNLRFKIKIPALPYAKSCIISSDLTNHEFLRGLTLRENNRIYLHGAFLLLYGDTFKKPFFLYEVHMR